MRWLKRILMGFGIAMLLIIGLLMVIVAMLPAALSIPQYFLKPKVEAEIAAIKAKGEPVTLEELAGPKIPDNENAALIYARIFKEMEKPQVTEDMKVLRHFSSEKERQEDPSLWSKARLAVNRNRHLLPIIEKAISRPKCQFPVDWEDGPDAKFPHYAQLRKLSCLLYASSLIDAKAGRLNEAIRSLELGFKINDSLKDESGLLPLLVRASFIRQFSNALRTISTLGDINVIQAERLFDDLSEIDMMNSNHRAMEGERAMGIALLTCMREHPTFYSDRNLEPHVYSEAMSRPVERTSGQFLSWRYADDLFYLQAMRRMLENAEIPYREAVRRGLNDDPEFPRYAIFSAILTPLYTRVRSGRDETITEVAGSQILLALVAYKERYNSYPQTLDELREKIGWNIPKDPFSGGEFIYKRQGNGFLLYSIGSDLKDDGGKEPTKDSHDKGDIIWRMEH